MRLSAIVSVLLAFATALGLSLLTATHAAGWIERASKSEVLRELQSEGLDWAEVDTNGLQVFLIGTAPDEARRFLALSTAGRVVDTARVIDQMLVVDPDNLTAPRFSIELLRNNAGISVIGLVPASTDHKALLARFEQMAQAEGATVSDLLESADFPAPKGWDEALRFATSAVAQLPRSKISVEADRVSITAMTDSEAALTRIEADLRRRAPKSLSLDLALSAPRPVITPFTLRFILDEDGARFDACSADTEAARSRILAAAGRAGLASEEAECRLGLGVPSRRWGEAVEMAIDTLSALKGTSVTFTNADVTLVAPEGTDQEVFDTAIAQLEAALPPVFALDAVLPQPPQVTSRGPMSFSVSFDPDKGAQLRGWLPSDLARQTALSFAKAGFGADAVLSSVRVAPELPTGWQVRALAGIEALSLLSSGSMSMTKDSFEVKGQTGSKDSSAQVSALLADALGPDSPFDIDVTYVEALDPALAIPTPAQCEAQIIDIIGERKITFEPSSDRLDASAEEILDELADLLKLCGEIPLEIGGHTDSQGREIMNQSLSRNRAQAVLDALRDRRVPVRAYSVVGYGETQPIADNGTEEGREANRRIEFRLIRPETPDAEATEDTDTTQDDAAAAAEDSAAEGADDTPAQSNTTSPAPEGAEDAEQQPEGSGSQGAGNE